MGGFMGIGQSKSEKAANTNTNNVFNTGLPIAQNSSASGAANQTAGINTLTSTIPGLDAASQHWQDILSGNRSAVAAAVAPTANAVNTSADAARNQEAQMGTARGGGVGAGNQALEGQRMGQINNAVMGAQGTAASGLVGAETAKAGVGQGQGQIGAQQLNSALQALGLSGQISQDQLNAAIQKEGILGTSIGGLTGLALLGLGGAGGGGGSVASNGFNPNANYAGG